MFDSDKSFRGSAKILNFATNCLRDEFALASCRESSFNMKFFSQILRLTLTLALVSARNLALLSEKIGKNITKDCINSTKIVLS